MNVFCSSFLPVTRTLSALMTITKSPVSTCGVKTVFSLPRNRLAAFTATFPSTWSAASITHHLCGTSLALAENVCIFEKGHKNYSRRQWLSTCPCLGDMSHRGSRMAHLEKPAGDFSLA